MDEFEAGKQALKSLIVCVDTALENESAEIATICAVPLAEMLNLEKANYFGYEDPVYNWNFGMHTVKRAFEFIEKEGVPSWLEDGVNRLKEIVRSWEYR